MARLNDEVAAKVEAAESNSGFKLLDDGIYLVRLTEDVTVKDGQKAPVWSWLFEVVEGQEGAGRKVYHNTSLSDAAFFKLKETFEAFGVSPATDTEELVGQQIRLNIVQKIAKFGKREGELVNEIKALLPKDGPTGVDEKAKAEREAAKAEASAAAPAAEGKPLF